MAKTLWGKVYYKDTYAGRLQEEPNGGIVFSYDSSYIQAKQPRIAHTLPLRAEPFLSEHGLHSFFDNLVAEGWFRNAQAKALGIDPKNRFSLLLGFGHDLAGAVAATARERRELLPAEIRGHGPGDRDDAGAAGTEPGADQLLPVFGCPSCLRTHPILVCLCPDRFPGRASKRCRGLAGAVEDGGKRAEVQRRSAGRPAKPAAHPADQEPDPR